MEKCAVALASPISTMLSATQRSQRMVGKLRQIERLVISRWPCSSFANKPSIKRADAASSSLSRPARAKVCGSVSVIQVERCGSYWEQRPAKVPCSVSREEKVKGANGRVEPIQGKKLGRRSTLGLNFPAKASRMRELMPSATTTTSASRLMGSSGEISD